MHYSDRAIPAVVDKLRTDKYSRLEEVMGKDLIERLVERILLEAEDYIEDGTEDEDDEEIEDEPEDWKDKIRL